MTNLHNFFKYDFTQIQEIQALRKNIRYAHYNILIYLVLKLSQSVFFFIFVKK